VLNIVQKNKKNPLKNIKKKYKNTVLMKSKEVRDFSKNFLQETNMYPLIPLPYSFMVFRYKPYQTRPSLKICEGTVEGGWILN
jgi:hypothetical protein